MLKDAGLKGTRAGKEARVTLVRGEVENPHGFPGAYRIEIGPERVKVTAPERQGMIHAAETHGARLPHTRVAELVDLFRTLPVRFRQRIPSLEPERADIILTGAALHEGILHALDLPALVPSTRGVRFGALLQKSA